MRPPPRAPLFPYTTLFRSHHVPVGPVVDLALAQDLVETPGIACLRLVGERAAKRDHLADQIGRTPCKDRKSTRLNSSHVAISYAVFCLKKKTKPPPPTAST